MTVGVTHTSGSRLVAQSADAARSGPCITGVRRGALLSQGASKSRTMADSAGQAWQAQVELEDGSWGAPARAASSYLPSSEPCSAS